MDDALASKLTELLDRQAIEDALLRYCRGVDRLDKALMLSAYHPDAVDDHGVVVLGAEAFCDWAIDYHRTMNLVTHHAITNLTIDVDGDIAHSECYYTYMGTVAGAHTQFSFGRYVDRHEKRDGLWAIAARFCFIEAVQELAPALLPDDYRKLMSSNGPSTRGRDDASYHRPLKVDDQRLSG
jgi:SnoaL-like domain